MLQPFLQVRIGLYNVVLSLIFCIIVGGYLYFKLMEFGEVVQTLTESDDTINELVRSYLISVGTVATSIGALFVLLSLGMSIYFTHKMVGPTIAFRRQINALKSGNYTAKISLRKGDAFNEVAQELNELADELKRQDSEDKKQAS
jgi:signal transduction histidine kinase